MLGKIVKMVVALVALLVVVVGATGYVTYKKLETNLPDIEALNDVELHLPLLVYTSDSKLMSEYGEKRREQVFIENVPQHLIDAFVSAEDDRFYEHPGVDYQGLLRAGFNLVRTGRKGQGGSTITMQVARNIYLSPEKTYLRKINEILLSLKIEKQITKEEILELYLNIIYFGNRAYGAASAARVYYGKELGELELPEAAMIAGLPKAPSAYNPVVNPRRALVRRNYVLRRMLELNKITSEEYRAALEQPVTARLHRAQSETEAGYVSEMARAQMLDWLGREAYTGGYQVYTTIDSRHQDAANGALRNALQAYEQRHGFRLPGAVEPADIESPEAIDAKLLSLPGYGGIESAIVLDTTETHANIVTTGAEYGRISWENMQWASPRSEEDNELPLYSKPQDILKALDLIHVSRLETSGEVDATLAAAELASDAANLQEDGDSVGADSVDNLINRTISDFRLTQMPAVEGAIVSLDPADGRLLALAGGFDFGRSKFNRVTQAYRQPGSNFKPFIYSAALENGDTPASIYNDTPVVLQDSVLESEWRPENYSGRFFGPTRLREALVKSRNLVSIRVLREMGISRAIRYARRFNFETRSLPNNLSLALGSGDLTPMQLATAYTVFANTGYAVKPYFIQRVVDGDGETLFEAPPVQRCEGAEDCERLQLQLDGTEQAAEGLQVQSGEADEASVDQASESPIAALPADEIPAEIDDSEVAGIPEMPSFVLAPRVIDERNAFIMRSIMREVIRRGTATRARALKRSDIAGKTGTTNDLYDAWFTGFNSRVVATGWVGYDEQKSLGPKETGGVATLPMWMDYMRVALDGVAEDREDQPEGVEMVRIDRKTGRMALPGSDNAFFEYFREENLPESPKEFDSSSQVRVIEPQRQSTSEVVIEETTAGSTNQRAQRNVTPVQPAPQRQKSERKVEQLF